MAKIIVFSGFAPAAVADEAIELGASRYFAKDVNADTINDAIEEVAAETMPAAL
jgi:ActR/RegA family two-component response regulator